MMNTTLDTYKNFALNGNKGHVYGPGTVLDGSFPLSGSAALCGRTAVTAGVGSTGYDPESVRRIAETTIRLHKTHQVFDCVKCSKKYLELSN